MDHRLVITGCDHRLLIDITDYRLLITGYLSQNYWLRITNYILLIIAHW